jgi:hypothetical protein
MSTEIIHKIINKDGAMIVMPPYKGGQEGWGNLSIPNPNLCDQSQRYPTGTILRMGYCTYIYTYLQVATSGRSITNAHGSGVLCENLPQDVTVVTATADATTITGAATATANQYAGGFLTIYESGVTHQTGCYRIVSNTATASSNVIFTLEHPLVTTYTASATCRIHPDPYSNVRFPLGSRTSSANFEMLAGIWVASEDEAGTAAAEGDYAWIQTGGPCFCWAAVTFEGGTAHERMAYHQGGGDIQICTATDAHPGAQIVGYLIPATSADPGVSTTGTDVDNMEHLIWLQIVP